MSANNFSLHTGIRMRRENFGGILFDPRNGTIVEVDREAYQMLSNLRSNGQSAAVIQTLLALGFLVEESGDSAAPIEWSQDGDWQVGKICCSSIMM
jgi:hypothetical protein